MVRSSCTLTYVLLSLAFIILNVITLGNLAPWVDEVMMLDTSYNMAVHGSWETTAWYRVAGQHPFSTYPPLYQLLAAAWIWLFGSSLAVVRSMNLLLTFMLGGTCLRLMTRCGQGATPVTTALFTLLLWGTGEMAWMYRNGRPDMLCALLFVCTVLAAASCLSAPSPSARRAVVVASALLFCSGVQAAVCLCAVWLFFFIAQKGRRKEYIRLFRLLAAGMLLGMLLVALFMLAHGRLTAFVCSIIQYSATLSAISLAVLPWAGEVTGVDTTSYARKLLELTPQPGFCERLASAAAYRSFLVLSVLALAAYASCFRSRLKALTGDWGFLMLLCALCVPLVMTLAGRYPVYYRWMAFLPLALAVSSISARRRFWRAVFGVAAVLLTVFGVRTMLPDGQWDSESLRAFVQRQHFKPSDAVVCPFSAFYEMKPVCNTCYFAGIFPTELIAHVDYIIEATDGDEFGRPITDYVNKLKADTTVVLTATDHCEHPSLTLYHVQTNYE